MTQSDLLKDARAQLTTDDFSVDDDIREIFIEEADEVFTTIHQYLPDWQANIDDLTPLTQIRCGFHTLKGSGRMVGAFQLGEVSWMVESTLNRILDGSLPITTDALTLVMQACHDLPILLNDFANRQSPSVDPAVLIAQATNIQAQRPINSDLLASASEDSMAMTSPVQPVNHTEQIIDTGTSATTLSDASLANDNAPVLPDTTTVSSLPVAQPVKLLHNDQASQNDLPINNVTTGLITLPPAVEAAYQQLTVVNDQLLDEDIQEIYIEEAKEVIDSLAELYQNWQYHIDDMPALKEIRRGFHTLKGSGRMVGANQLGELAWSIENMLNRVLDNTISINSGISDLLYDVIAGFGDLIDVFANNSQDYPAQMQLWQAIANAYTANQGDTFDYQAIKAYQSADQQVDTQLADYPAMPVISDEAVITEDIELSGGNQLTLNNEILLLSDNAQSPKDVELHGQLTAVDTPSSTQSVTAEDDINASTIAQPATPVNKHDQIFIDEARFLLARIANFIYSHQYDNHVAISNDLVRAFHTLRGGAAIAKVPRIHALSAALEESLGALLRKEVALTPIQLQLLSEARNELAQYITDYQQSMPTAVQADDEQHIETMTQALLTHVNDDQRQTKLSVSELIELGIDDLLDLDQDMPVVFTGSDEAIIAYADTIANQAATLANELVGLSYLPIPEMLQFTFNKVTQYPSFAKDADIIAGILALHSQLINMFDAFAAGLTVGVDTVAIDQFQQLLAEKQYEAEINAVEYETINSDVELLEIFLDEAKSLRSTIQTSFNQWQNNLSNLAPVKELHRYLHILKGGANLVGVSSVATLAHRGESLYEAIEEGRLNSDPDIALIMQKVTDIINVQLQYISQQHRSFFAKKFINQLDQLLAKQLQARDISPIVPIIVEPQQEEYVSSADSEHADHNTIDNSADPLYVQDVINNFEQRRLDTWHGKEPDPDILNIFLEEAKELIDNSSQQLQILRSNNNDIAALQSLQRDLHTIKGGARMVGAEGLANLAHEMESIYEELGSRRKPATRMIGKLLFACHDWLANSLYVLENNYNPQNPTLLIRALQDFSSNPDSLKAVPNASLAKQIEQIDIYKSSQQTEQVETKVRDLTIMPAMTGNFEVEQTQTNLNSEMLRISASLMERMINLSGESAINRARIEMGVSSLVNTIDEMGATVQRLADQLRRMETELEVQILSQLADNLEVDSEFDPLEMDQYSSLNQLSKSLSESASDLLDIKTTMLDKTRDTENLLLQLARTQTELQEGLMNSRTVPFSRITPRLQRIARQTASELGKSVELRILNEEGEMEVDRNILERITSPLEHMLRNAIDHGIEKTQERIEHGKPRIGLITLEMLQEGNEIVIHLTDDGKGIDVNAVRQKAIEQRLIAADDTSLKPLDIMQYIFSAGLTTSKTVTQISGRGVGMDVVQSEVKQLGGVVLVESEAGRGSRFTMRLPLTVAVSDALVVKAADKQFAIPLVQIERVVRVDAETISQFHASGADSLMIEGQDYRLRYLNQILYGSDPLEALRQQLASVPVIIIRTETGQKMALQIDAIAGSRIEMVVKPLGRQLSHIAGISAATIMGDGSVMLILDLIALMRNASVTIKTLQQQSANQRNTETDHKPMVLIVDDSVTVRKVTSRLLERNGYETQVAIDGIDAIEKLQKLTPDIILLDIEMPRMDGFEVANQIRHNPRLKQVPIIMITSRTGEKHRSRAFSIGVNQYLGKPFQEQHLLDTISQLLTVHSQS